jgi:predicted TIM-barrel fold metal-dependent hydrolase
MEPEGLWLERMPAALAERMPRSERTERVHVDGNSFERQVPLDVVVSQEDMEAAGLTARSREAGMLARALFRPPGWLDPHLRLQDLDHEGIWAEIQYPSIGLWNGLISDPVLYREGVRVFNDWLKENFIDVSPRFVPAAEISVRAVDDAVAETVRAAAMGFKAINTPVELPDDLPPWYAEEWEPFWATLEEIGMVVASHIGSIPIDIQGNTILAHAAAYSHHGPGGAVRNYVETCFSVQRYATMMVSSGILDRHPNLKVLVSEGGASWIPFIADRMTEAYRQHGVWVRPKLSRLPSEIIYEQVYASFQHDRSAVQAYQAMGYKNVLWGSDYPHMEGTYGHSQKTLHQLFDDVDEETRYRLTRGAFLELFPHVGEPPTEKLTAG